MLFSLASAAASRVPFELTVHLNPQRPDELETLFWRVADPSDSLYAQHQLPHQLRYLAGATDVSINEVSVWLRSLGGTDVEVSALGDRVTASVNDQLDSSQWSARGLPLSSPMSASLVTRRDFSPPRADSVLRSPRVDVVEGDSESRINSQKKAYGIPQNLAATDERTTQMVWGFVRNSNCVP